MLLDITLPKQSGLWVLERLREAQNHVPVIVLSARQDEFDKVAALRLGADDYVTKPFALAELLARVDGRAAARAPQPRPRRARGLSGAGRRARPPYGRTTTSVLRFGDVIVDLGASAPCSRGGAPVKLTHLEFELLSFFCAQQRPGLLARGAAARGLGPAARRPGAHRRQLRGAAARQAGADPDQPRHLLTVRGSGYRFVS